jgi:hypothetical protein
MRRTFSLMLVIAAALAFAAQADAAPSKKKRVARHDRGYGFLPGYRSPERIARDEAQRRGAVRYGYGGYYLYGPYGYAGFYWAGRPGFYRERWNGGSFGPCWTRTPIGPMWNCGK